MGFQDYAWCLARRGKERKEVVPGTHRDSLLTRTVASVLGWGLSEIDLKTKISAETSLA